MPFDLMVGLACIHQLNFYDQQLVLKGLSTMFVPVESDNSAKWITWHLYIGAKGERVALDRASDTAIWPRRAHVPTLDVEGWRHFVD